MKTILLILLATALIIPFCLHENPEIVIGGGKINIDAGRTPFGLYKVEGGGANGIANR